MTVKIQEDPAFVDIPLSEPKASKKQSTDQVHLQLQDIINTMKENVVLAANRGESLHSIQQKSQSVAESSRGFTQNAKSAKKRLWWKNFKWSLLILLLLLICVGLTSYLFFSQKWVSSRPRTQPIPISPSPPQSKEPESQ